MDLEGLSFKIVTHTTARKVVKDVVSMLQNHYPECSGRMIIINAPRVFGIAWSFVKPQLDAKTVEKISIFGSDQREAYVQCLLDLVDADQLPQMYGGTCVCDGQDPMSCMRAVKGPWAKPEVLKILEEHPLDEVLTPEGAKLLQKSQQ
ncbi:SFH1, partial [Symbiodinium necroappetens]